MLQRRVADHEVWKGETGIAQVKGAGTWGDARPGDTLFVTGDTIATGGEVVFSAMKRGPVDVLAVSATGDSVSGRGVLRDYNTIDISFDRHRVKVDASWDDPATKDPKEWSTSSK
jgi:hypothetical protein